MKQIKLMLGDNMYSLKKLPDNSVDSVVTDGPYGLSFMNKKWDYDIPSVELWKEIYRVLKPGGHVLSFGGTRTYHRMVVNIEDAGFEIRDQIMWIYGSGFPKSHNIGKAVDKIKGNDREVVGTKMSMAPPEGEKKTKFGFDTNFKPTEIELTKGTTPQEGWGTAIKPANEPICVARKPLSESTIAANVLKWGTGGINIDGCRIGTEDKISGRVRTNNTETYNGAWQEEDDYEQHTEGRFPANIIFDESAASMLDEQSGLSVSSGSVRKASDTYENNSGFGKYKDSTGPKDKGGASRFFYIAKVSKSERNMGLDNLQEPSTRMPRDLNSYDEVGNIIRADGSIIPPAMYKNTHPTLKPVQLMAYLCRLVTPVGGIVLDPFLGSGSTGISACLEGFRFVGMEMNEEYFKIAEARIEAYEKYRVFTEKKKKKK